MTVENEIKAYGIKLGADQAGIASVKDVNLIAPAGYRPDDILLGAKSVISYVARWTPRGAWQSPHYMMHHVNRSFGGSARMKVSLGVSHFIEKTYGYYALAMEGMMMSQKVPVELAGLGTRSLAGGIILNPELGPLNIATVLTTMPLEADPPLRDPVCPHRSCVTMYAKKKTTPCLDKCPECLSGELEKGSIKWMRFNRHLCATRAQTLSPSSFQRTLLEIINEPDPDKRKTMLLGGFFSNIMRQIAGGVFVGQCGECLRVCPVAIKARTLKPKLTGIKPKRT
ncbi:MAG: hypothetical protein Q8P24_15480 [Desulfobacterales bacterium]|nr:hypothetical protein [Desulfobacterales bacterium]